MDNNITYYVTYDIPVPYKEIKIYPIKVLDYLLFNYYSQCLTLDKNSIPDIKIIQMTDLEYIFYRTQEDPEKNPYLFWFDRMLAMCLQEEDSFKEMGSSIQRYNYDDKGKPFFKIGEETYSSDDFDKIKSIICEQNLIELPDEKISKEVRDSLEKAKEYKNKMSGTNPGSLEDYIISLSTVTGWSMEYIYTIPVRKFIKSIRRYDNYIHYKIYLSASMSGMVEFKDKSFIKHWLTNIDEDEKYGDVSVSLDSVQSKLSMESAKTG